MDLNNTLTLISIVGGILTIVAGLVGLFGAWRGWWESPDRRAERERAKAVADAILGEPPVPDRSGGLIQPGQPGLVARMTKVEEAVVEFRHLVGLYTETQKRLDIHDSAINALIAGSLERAATAMSAAAMWTAVQNRDLIDVESEERP